MQIGIKNINNQIDSYPRNSEIKTFYINNNKNTNIIEISVTKDEANKLLTILNTLDEIDLKNLKKIISIDNDHHNYYEQLKQVIISSWRSERPYFESDRITYYDDNHPKIQSLNQPNILMLLRKILKENNHRGLLCNPQYTSRVKLIMQSLKDISNDKEFLHSVRYGYGLFGINKIKYNLLNTNKLFNPAATVSLDKVFSIATTPQVATNTLKILNILNKQDLDNMRIKKDNYYKNTYNAKDFITYFKDNISYDVLSKKSENQIKYYKNIFDGMNQNDQEKYIDLLYKIIDNNKHRGFTQQKYTSRAKLIIESLQSIINGSEIPVEPLSSRENIIRYIPPLKSILSKKDKKNLNKKGICAQQFIDEIIIPNIKEISQKYNEINQTIKDYNSYKEYVDNFDYNKDYYDNDNDYDITEHGKRYNKSVRKIKELEPQIAKLTTRLNNLSYKLDILNKFHEIYEKVDHNTRVIIHKLLINQLMLPKIRNTAEEIPKRFDISNTTKHSSFGRSLLGKKNTYALFIKDINKIHVEENDLINQGYNYPQIEEIEPK